ncbi:uL22 family ribosomal protein [Candidatus Vidania fulgoroideorum]
MIEEKNSLLNFNCSFKKIKKLINYIKDKNLINIFNIFIFNKSKNFRILKKIFRDNINNFFNKYKYNCNNISINYLFVTKSKTFKKIFPRARGKCDFTKRRLCNVFLSLFYFLGG